MKLVLLSLLLMLVATHAHALDVPDSCPQRPADEDSAKALAKTWFSKGEKAVEEKDYATAVGEFACSLRMIEHEATLFNAARAAQLAGRYDDAIELAEKIIAKAKDDETKAEARELVAQAEAAKPKEPVQFVVEEEESSPSPAIVPNEATKPQEKPATEAAVVAEDDDRSGLKIAGIVSLAVGGAGLVVGAVLQGLAGSAAKTTKETDSYQEYEDAKSRLGGLQTGAIVSFVAGGVFLATGIVMALVGSRNEDEKKPVAVSLTPTPGGLVLGGTF